MTKTEWAFKFKKRLRLMMEKKEYTQKELAMASGISEVSINRYYNGHRIPDAFNLAKLAKALGCTTDELAVLDEFIKVDNKVNKEAIDIL